MKQYAGFVALAALSLAAAGWITLSPDKPQTFNRDNSAHPETPTSQTRQGSGFDFYVLSLSWSPAFCQSDAGRNSRQQCGTDRRYGFVVHGLWPQNESGYPQFCGKSDEERVPESLGRTMFDIMPSMGLIGHQWRKHGTCSGLSQKDYLATTRAAFERLVIPQDISSGADNKTLSPDAIESALVSANAGMTKQGIAITCEAGKLEEIRICMNKELSFRSCAQVDRQGCRANTTEIIPIR